MSLSLSLDGGLVELIVVSRARGCEEKGSQLMAAVGRHHPTTTNHTVRDDCEAVLRTGCSPPPPRSCKIGPSSSSIQ